MALSRYVADVTFVSVASTHILLGDCTKGYSKENDP